MTVNLAAIPEPCARAFIAGYGEGYAHGISRGLADAEAAEDAAWAELSARVRKQANSPRHSQLCDRRGEHDRAATARARERRNGLDLAG